MAIIPSHFPVLESAVRYKGLGKLSDLAEEISQKRKLNSGDTKKLIKKATLLRLYLKALDYRDFLTVDQKNSIKYAIVGIGQLFDFGTAPILSNVNRPSILIGNTITNTTIINGGSGSGSGIGVRFLNSDVDTGAEVVDSFPVSYGTGVVYTYTATSGVNQRSGTITATWLADGSTIEWEEDSTDDIGTVDVTMSVVINAGNVELTATATSDNWYIEGSRSIIADTTGITVSSTLTEGAVLLGNASNEPEETFLQENEILVGSASNITATADTAAQGDILASTSGLDIKAGVIVNADVNASAAIVYSKLSIADGDLTIAKTSGLQTALDGKVNDTGDETIAGVKTFSSDPIIPDEAYGVAWNGSLEPPTKNAVYDKIETITSQVSDTAFATSWDGVTTIAPSKNAVYDAMGGVITYIIETGDWNMDLNSELAVPHGLADHTKILAVEVVIYPDTGSGLDPRPLNSFNDAVTAVNGGVRKWDATNIRLLRLSTALGGDFDNTDYNATSFNRGKLKISYLI